ncbi:hypothetical protein [Streptomyces virginiae]|uniref:hypothetical protein n=1 Tax=Streptomyces virginiae TaxID=1961 RepID=UPI0034401FE6
MARSALTSATRGGADEGGVQDVTAPHVAEKRTPSPGVRGSQGGVLGVLTGGVRMQRYGPADRAQRPPVVRAAQRTGGLVL